jgi:hypothetical protein
MTTFNHRFIARATALALLGVVSAFCHVSQPSADTCANFDWRAQLQADQAYILSKLPLHVNDMEQALAPGGALENYELAHLYTDLLGNGATLNLKDETQLGRRDYFLFYAGNPEATVEDATNANLPKNPYTLVG